MPKTTYEIPKLPEQFHFAKQHWYNAADIHNYLLDVTNGYESEILKLKSEYERKIADLTKHYEDVIAELRQSHRNDIEDFVRTHESLTASIRHLLNDSEAYVERRSSLLLTQDNDAPWTPAEPKPAPERPKCKLVREAFDPIVLFKDTESRIPDEEEYNGDRQGE